MIKHDRESMVPLVHQNSWQMDLHPRIGSQVFTHTALVHELGMSSFTGDAKEVLPWSISELSSWIPPAFLVTGVMA